MADEKEKKGRGSLYDHKSSQKANGDGDAKRPDAKEAETPVGEKAAEDEKPADGEAKADPHKEFSDGLAAMHARHRTERRDHHGNHKASLDQMFSRHSKEMDEMAAKHGTMLAAGPGVTAEESAGGKEAPEPGKEA